MRIHAVIVGFYITLHLRQPKSELGSPAEAGSYIQSERVRKAGPPIPQPAHPPPYMYEYVLSIPVVADLLFRLLYLAYPRFRFRMIIFHASSSECRRAGLSR